MDIDLAQIDVAAAAAIGNTFRDAALLAAAVVFPWNDYCCDDFFLDVFWVPLYSW